MTDALVKASTRETEDAAGLLQRLVRSNVALFVAWFALILLLKWPTLTQPPVWDGSMSVFPAAITLAEHNFDLGYLLDQPGYGDGGPNVHSISLVTWFTAIVISLIGGMNALFPVLHLIHFGIAAFAMTGLFRFAHPLLGPTLSAAASVTILLFPLVLTQAGYVYLEFPMLAATAFAALAWTRGNVHWSVFWSVAAVLIKGSGVIVPIALAGMAFFDPRRECRDRRVGLLMLVVPVTVLGASISLIPSLSRGANIRDYMVGMFQYLTRVPDLLILLLAYLAVTLVFSPFRSDKTWKGEPVTTEIQSGILMVAFIVISFLGFYLLLPLAGVAVSVLPRYYVQVVPFALIGLMAALRRLVTGRVLLILLLATMMWFGVNRNGAFYPDNTLNNFALIERSGRYVDLLDIQRKGIQALIDLPDGVPVFYDQPAHYKLSYPHMGYAPDPIPNGHSILHEDPYRGGRLRDFPDEFYMLHEYSWLGGELVKSIWQQALDDPERSVVVDEICSLGFCSRIIHVKSTRTS